MLIPQNRRESFPHKASKDLLCSLEMAWLLDFSQTRKNMVAGEIIKSLLGSNLCKLY